MARVKGALATRKRRKKTLKLAKGYFGAKSKLFKTAKEAVMKSFENYCQEYGTVEKPAKIEGRNMIMFLAPKSGK